MSTASSHWLHIDPAAVADEIARAVAEQVSGTLRRRGVVVALSGGVDSSVCAGLAVRALGPARVLGLAMPERESDPCSLQLAREWAGALGIELVVEDVTAILEAFGCYRRRDDAARRVVPEFGAGWGMKVVLPGLDAERLNVTRLVVRAPDGTERTERLPGHVYREIVAASSFKQRARKMMEYFHADRLHYAVMGTPNRLEYDQGFFVKGGDGLADLKPIAHLYKTQVYALARWLGVPDGVLSRPPTTDTYSLPQTQEEFYFALPAATLDVLLHARNGGLAPVEAALRAGVRPPQAAAAYEDIARKRAATRPLHVTSLLVEPVPEVGGVGEAG
jgi:NAD+ synthase